jgi:hypothetical protein
MTLYLECKKEACEKDCCSNNSLIDISILFQECNRRSMRADEVKIAETVGTLTNDAGVLGKMPNALLQVTASQVRSCHAYLPVAVQRSGEGGYEWIGLQVARKTNACPDYHNRLCKDYSNSPYVCRSYPKVIAGGRLAMTRTCPVVKDIDECQKRGRSADMRIPVEHVLFAEVLSRVVSANLRVGKAPAWYVHSEVRLEHLKHDFPPESHLLIDFKKKQEATYAAIYRCKGSPLENHSREQVDTKDQRIRNKMVRLDIERAVASGEYSRLLDLIRFIL